MPELCSCKMMPLCLVTPRWLSVVFGGDFLLRPMEPSVFAVANLVHDVVRDFFSVRGPLQSEGALFSGLLE